MHVRTPTLRVGLLLLVVSFSGAVGCKNQEKCNDAMSTARKAMQDEFLDMALARQWRDHAGKICGQGPELQTLDKEIVDREAALAKAVEDAAKKAADDGQAALKQAEKLWKSWDKLEEKEQDKAALVKVNKKARKLVLGLTPDYAKQVETYNSKQYKARTKKLAKEEKK
jgi:hypothetical protein